MRARLYSTRGPLAVLLAIAILIAGCSGAAKGRIAAPDGRPVLTERPAIADEPVDADPLNDEPAVEVLGTTVEPPEPQPAPATIAPEKVVPVPDDDIVEPPTWAIVGVARGLNVRSGPGTGFDVLAEVEKDQLLVGTGKTDGSWLQVVSGETVGWVVAAYLEAAPTADDAS